MSDAPTRGNDNRPRTPLEWIGGITVLLVVIAAAVGLFLLMEDANDQKNKRALESLTRQSENNEKNGTIERIHSLQRQLAVGKPMQVLRLDEVRPDGFHGAGEIIPPETPTRELWDRSLSELQAMEATLKNDLERDRQDRKQQPPKEEPLKK